MNSIIEHYYPTFVLYQALRGQMMDLLVDEDLAFTLPGNPSLGALCVEIGETEQAYIDSFRTFKQDFGYRLDDPEMSGRVGRLQEWYARLDAELRAAVEALTEDDLQNKVIERGFSVSPQIQLTIYNEALLIFYGKASVYLKALKKTLPKQWADWIA